MVVSGFEKNLAVLLRTIWRWPRGFMTPADLIQIGLRCQRIQNESLRKGNLPGRIWHGLGGDSLGTMAVEKNDVDRKRSIDRNRTKRATRINASSTWIQVEGRVIMHVFTFSYGKISLGNDERQWVVDCVRQPRKKQWPIRFAL